MVLDLLQIPFDAKEDVRMNELMRLAHQFLQNFCLGNQNNQVSARGWLGPDMGFANNK